MTLISLAEGEQSKWDEYVLNHPQGTIFQTSKWLRNIHPKPDVYVWKNDAQLISGGIALAKTKRFGVNGYHYPPFTSYIFPLFGLAENNFQYNAKEYNQFVGELCKILAKHKYIDLAYIYGHHNILPFHQKGFVSEILVTHLLKDKSVSEWLNRLNKNKGRELNKLLKEVELSNIIVHEDAKKEEIIPLLNNTSARKSFQYSESTLANMLAEHNQDYIKTFVIETAEHGFISAGVFVYDHKNVYNIVNASKAINHSIYKTINLLTLYKGIEFALSNNLAFDFEGSMLPGVEEFYRLMGGEQQPVYRLYKSSSPLMLAFKSFKLIRKQYRGQ